MRLIFTSGSREGQAVDIDGGRLMIGRVDDNDLQLAGDKVSRHHALIEVEDGGRLVLRDLNSRNGTYVDGVRLSESRVLTGGERLRVGDEHLLVEAGPGAAATAAAPPPPLHQPPLHQPPPLHPLTPPAAAAPPAAAPAARTRPNARPGSAGERSCGRAGPLRWWRSAWWPNSCCPAWPSGACVPIWALRPGPARQRRGAAGREAALAPRQSRGRRDGQLSLRAGRPRLAGRLPQRYAHDPEARCPCHDGRGAAREAA